MKVVVIKYNAGNIQSVSFALERMHIDFEISGNSETIQQADKVIFPGVGEAHSTMEYLRNSKLNELIPALKQPVLGICLGMQLMCNHSEENNTTCLGIFNEQVKKFDPTPDQKVPHMGWNQLTNVKGWISPTLENQFTYFVHSYYVPVNPHTVATTQYIEPFSAVMQKDNFYAVQFHPEKSADTGTQILKCFLAI
jgi:glutamine amidotransferase